MRRYNMKDITKQQADEIFYRLAVKKETYKQIASDYGMEYTTLCTKMKKYKAAYGMTAQDRFTIKNYLKYYCLSDIVDKYNSGYTTKDFEQEYPASERVFADLLKEQGVLRQSGVPSRTNQSLFSSIKDEYDAYVLGLITSDGSIGKDYSVSIDLAHGDRDLLEQINKIFLNDSGHIFQYGENTKSHKDNPMVRLRFNGKQICNNLAQYGVVPKKSYLLQHLQLFEEPLMQHYLRGLFDGDGVVSQGQQRYLRIGFCSHNRTVVEDYFNYFVSHLGLNRTSLFNTGQCWQCSWAAKDNVQKFYSYIYNDANIYLLRKKEKIEKYLNGNTEVTS